MSELVLDPSIRVCVFLPIVIITFLVAIIRHYVSILLTSEKKVDISQLQYSHFMMRAKVSRENAKYIPESSFAMRRQFFDKEETRYRTQRQSLMPQNFMTDPTMLNDMLKENLTNSFPMIVIGGWINWMFSGFLITKVPFPLTPCFKPMLQRGIELNELDASWVSSTSWYFLNVFGLKNIYTHILGGNENTVDTELSM